MDELAGRDVRIYRKLKESYPDNRVSGIAKHEMYHEVRERCLELDLPLDEYLASLGFEYIRKSSRLHLEALLERLFLLFPDKQIVGGISDIHEKEPALLNQLRYACRANGMDLRRCLEENGYTVFASQKVTSSNFLYDHTALKRLKEEYNAKMTDFARWFGISKQAVHNQLSAKRESQPFWRGKEMSEDEKVLIGMMAEERLYEYHDEEITVVFYRHREERKLAILILYHQEKEVKCFFEIPPDVEALLKENHLDRYTKLDTTILNDISDEKLSYTDMFDERVVRYAVSEHQTFDSRVRRAQKFHSFADKKDYFSFLGFKYVSSQEVTDDDIRERLKEFLIPGTNRIHIPINHPRYQYFMRTASLRGMPFGELVRHVGYEYERTRTVNTKERYMERLKPYMVDGKTVYIHYDEPVYRSLTAYAYKNGSTLTGILSEWGISRLLKEELPEGFAPYRFSYDLGTEEGLIRLLEDMADGNQVFLDPGDVVYRELNRWAILNDTTVNELLEKWGFERVYLQDVPEMKQREFSAESPSEETFRGTLLERLGEIQGNLERSSSKTEKMERSRSLAQTVKKFYEYRCQLCSEEEGAVKIPLIEKEDGTLYVEAHHIVPVSSVDVVQDDVSALIDSYINVVVVCAHHHRQLHFHNGGYQKLIMKDGNLNFVSKNGGMLRVYTNYHLVPSDEWVLI